MEPHARPVAGAANTIQGALSDEAVRLEGTIARGGMVLAAAGLVLSIYTAAVVSAPLGLTLVGFALVLLAWFSGVIWMVARGVATRALPWLCPLVEISLPSCLVIIDTLTEGPIYALQSSGPMQFYQVFVGLAVLRLKPYVPALVGGVGALQYALIYLLLVRPRLPEDFLAPPALRTDMVLMRAVVIALGGVAGTLISTALRGVVGRAQSAVRARDLFGKYRLEKELAQGGMGTVWRATYCPEGGFVRPVAIKRIHPHLSVQPHLVEAFRKEAELCARLNHPNIVQVMDFGRVDDTYFLAMEFVEGHTLLDLMRRGQTVAPTFPPRWVAYVGREMCEGLNFAHVLATDETGQRLRVVHRDLNPPNVMVSKGGQVKLMDYGIAKALKGAAQSLTRSAAGKLGYMSPEQATGGPLDERTDLFAVGIILWEVLFLRHLFQRDEDAESLNLLLHAPIVPPSTFLPELGAPWDAFFHRALAREPAARFQTAAEMRDALDAILELEGVPRPGEFEAYMASLPPLDAPAASVPTQPVQAAPVGG